MEIAFYLLDFPGWQQSGIDSTFCPYAFHIDFANDQLFLHAETFATCQ